MVSLYFSMLENYSDTCQMPEPHIYLRMCHPGKLSLTKVTGRAAEGGTLNFKCFLLLASLCSKATSEELTYQKNKSLGKTDLFEKGR